MERVTCREGGDEGGPCRRLAGKVRASFGEGGRAIWGRSNLRGRTFPGEMAPQYLLMLIKRGRSRSWNSTFPKRCRDLPRSPRGPSPLVFPPRIFGPPCNVLRGVYGWFHSTLVLNYLQNVRWKPLRTEWQFETLCPFRI